MINFTSNLYKSEWLELVFQNRNKSYGAYQLRLHNSQTTVKALIIASTLFTSLIISPLVYGHFFKDPVIEEAPPVEVKLTRLVDKVKEIQPPPARPPAPSTPQRNVRDVQMVVVPATPDLVEPPTQSQIETAIISTQTTTGVEGKGLNPLSTSSGTESVAKPEPAIDNTLYSNTTLIEAYPEFPGGQAAFAKFLGRNLRFPASAIDEGVHGKVLVSFIIEKSGELSNIKILNGIGAGCDEEAIRVLLKSPRWKAGVQNKQKVRVMYTLPINFQTPE